MGLKELMKPNFIKRLEDSIDPDAGAPPRAPAKTAPKPVPPKPVPPKKLRDRSTEGSPPFTDAELRQGYRKVK